MTVRLRSARIQHRSLAGWWPHTARLSGDLSILPVCLIDETGRAAITACPAVYRANHGGMIGGEYLHGVAGPSGRSIWAGNLVVQE